MNIYISTTCLKDGQDVKKVLNAYGEVGIKNVELGSSHQYPERIISFLKECQSRYEMNFIVHHYFPPPKNSFIVNLASQNPVILEKSISQIKHSIEFCGELGIQLFSFHIGFRMDPNGELRPDGGFQFDKDKPMASYNKAFETFVKSVEEINNYAVQKGVKLAAENNVLSEYNLINGKNKFFLGCESQEFEQFFKEISSDNLGLLLDLGHLKVTSHWLNFDRYGFIDRLRDKVFLIHVHENNGKIDQHKMLDKNSRCFEIISRKSFKEIPVSLEAVNLSVDEIVRNQTLITKYSG